MSDYDLDAIRKKLKEKSSRTRDPNEFVPKKAESTAESDKYRFYVLPPFKAGDEVVGGKASRDLESFVLQNGMHWVNKRPSACPRVLDESPCPMCDTGFALADGVTDKKTRANIFKTWMPNVSYLMNIYFTNSQTNPEDLRGRVMWYAAPKTVYDIMHAAIFRDSYGDPEEPEGFGAFFDPKKPLLFGLNIKKAYGQSDDNKSYNDYKSSTFLVTVDKESGKVSYGQLAKSDEGVKLILANRTDLWTKVDQPDADKLAKLRDSLLHGAGGDGGNSGFQNETEEKPKTESKKTVERETEPEEKAKPASNGTTKAGKLGNVNEEAKEKPAAREEVQNEGREEAEESSGESSGDAADDEIENILSKLKKKATA